MDIRHIDPREVWHEVHALLERHRFIELCGETYEQYLKGCEERSGWAGHLGPRFKKDGEYLFYHPHAPLFPRLCEMLGHAKQGHPIHAGGGEDIVVTSVWCDDESISGMRFIASQDGLRAVPLVTALGRRMDEMFEKWDPRRRAIAARTERRCLERKLALLALVNNEQYDNVPGARRTMLRICYALFDSPGVSSGQFLSTGERLADYEQSIADLWNSREVRRHGVHLTTPDQKLAYRALELAELNPKFEEVVYSCNGRPDIVQLVFEVDFTKNDQ